MWGVALFTVASLFTLVAFHVFEAQSAFTLERLSKERTNEQLRYQRLRQQVASESSASVVIDASNKLGMVPAPSAITLTVLPAQQTRRVQQPVAVPQSAKDYSDAKQALEPYEP
jgi:hypothetical protein